MDWTRLLTPEVAGGLVGLTVLLLAKSKFFTEQDFKRARDMVDLGLSAGQAAQETRLKLDEVVGEVQREEGAIVADTSHKKAQRIVRKALRGWLRF